VTKVHREYRVEDFLEIVVNRVRLVETGHLVSPVHLVRKVIVEDQVCQATKVNGEMLVCLE
jgi:hypothetical protein